MSDMEIINKMFEDGVECKYCLLNDNCMKREFMFCGKVLEPACRSGVDTNLFLLEFYRKGMMNTDNNIQDV